MQNQELSPNQRAFRRLLKNKPAVVGMFLIAIATLMAILGYLITPDSTPEANDQVNEIALKPPGFQIQMVKVRKNREFPRQSILKTMISGKPNPFRMVPINKYVLEDDSVALEVYQGDEVKGKVEVYHLADVLYPLSIDKPEINKNGNELEFYSLEDGLIELNSDELKKQFLNSSIITKSYPFGTDGFGRCLLSRLLIGVRISLAVGLVAVLISLTIGILLGALAGYLGGKTDDFIMLLINTTWSIPTLLLVFALVLALGRGFWQIFTAVGLTMWVDVARIVRGQVKSLRTNLFVEAAHSLGFGTWRILSRHILPNILGPVMVIAAANFAAAILIEAGLSYLGFGIQPPQPSWGTMLSENYSILLMGGNPFPAIVPGLAIMLMVLSFNLVGNGLRDALDVKAISQSGEG